MTRILLLIIMVYTITGCEKGYIITGVEKGYTIEDIDLSEYIDNGEIVPIIVGEQLTIYGDEVASVPIVNNLTVDYFCGIGSQSGNDYVIDAIEEAEVYLYILAVNAGVVIRKTRSLLSIKSKVNTGSKTITLVGNSLILGGGHYEFDKLREIFSAMTWIGIGTVNAGYGNLTEGHGGKSYEWLVDDPDSPFTKAGVLDIPAYYVDNGLSVPDYIYLRMGINDAFYARTAIWTSEQISAWLEDITNFIDAFLAYDGSVEIIVGLPAVCMDSAEGWEAAYGADPYQDNYITIIHQMWDALIETYIDYDARVTVAYAPWGLDRDDGYPKSGGVHTNAVHCNSDGYGELGQGLAFALNNIL